MSDGQRTGDQQAVEQNENKTEVRIASQRQHETQYDESLPHAYSWGAVEGTFVRGILDEIGYDGLDGAGRTLDRTPLDADEMGALLVYPDETRLFVGIDDTAHNKGDYGFGVRPNDPVPLPSTAKEALDLLKPLGVHSHLDEEGELPPRQGEWWLLDTDRTPEGSVFRGGVNEKPFGGSPMENHVPTEYGFGVPDEALFSWFEREHPQIVMEGDTLPDIFYRMRKAEDFRDLDGVELITETPDFSEIRERAGGIFVRGTLRHCENDHYMERIGDGWKLARTHDMEVFTPDRDRSSTRNRNRVRYD